MINFHRSIVAGAFFAVACLTGSERVVFGQQWSPCGSSLCTSPTGAYVGIGTTSPPAVLSVQGQGSAAPFEVLSSSGAGTVAVDSNGDLHGLADNTYFSFDAGGDRMGFAKQAGGYPMLSYSQGSSLFITQSSGATISPANTFKGILELDGAGDISALADNSFFGFDAGADRIGFTKVAGGPGFMSYSSNPGGNAFLIQQSSGNTIAASNTFTPRFLIDASGNTYLSMSGGSVGIGTNDPCGNAAAPQGCMLSVSGTIQAKEVVVNSGWSDYVFDRDYKLTPLNEVAQYVEENHHLPGIPSAAEVGEKGVSLGEMQSKLLAKVEELTLHLIEVEKRERALEERNASLEKQLHTIAARGVEEGK